MCTDQLLLDMVPPARILGLSPYAGDAVRSWVADKAASLPKLSGTAEEVLILKPDLVLLSRYMKPETLDFIRRRGIPHAEFDDVRSLEEAKAQILVFGTRVGEAEAAEARVEAIETALQGLRATAAATGIRVLPLARRGWVAGKETLMSDLLAKAGLSNAAAELGIQDGGFVSLEAIVKLRPDAILVARDDLSSEDQGAAMMLHPAIQALFPPERRLYLSEKLTVCGGPMLAEAIRQLATQIGALKKR
ncbi:MAG: iron ABC transporter [Rhizobiales bacterium PAR1]|nr:MAG: iron ABC transporter [Rhizobiales bacterium PAR1]